jgi:predicted phage tail protein
MIAFLVPLLISLAINIVAYLITPKPKQPKPEAAKQSEVPTADAGIPVPVVFGTITVKALNCLWYGDQTMQTFQVKA